MSRLDELIKDLCPDGVEYKRFDEVCSLHARIGWQRLTKAEYQQTGDFMLITGTDFTPQNTINYDSCVYVSKERYEQDPKIQIQNEDVLITKDGTLGKVAQVKALNMPATLNGGIFVVRSIDGTLLPRYILHFLKSGFFMRAVNQQKTGSTISHLTQELFSRLLIPVPPLPVQQEIVRILDSFTELTEELTAELEARKKQFGYFLDKTLFESKQCAHVTLNKCCESISDGDHQPPPKADSGVPFITISNISNNQIDFSKTNYVPESYYLSLQNKRRAQMGDILYSVVGSFGIPVYIGFDMPFVFQRHIAIIRPNKSVVLPKYMYYCMKSIYFYKQADSVATGAAQRTIGLASLGKMTIPLCPLEEQHRIVNILESFDALVNDITNEIAMRQKQYEYYRDKLLTFKHKEEVSE